MGKFLKLLFGANLVVHTYFSLQRNLPNIIPSRLKNGTTEGGLLHESEEI